MTIERSFGRNPYKDSAETTASSMVAGVANPLGYVSSAIGALAAIYAANKNYQAQIATNESNERNVTATNEANAAINQANNDYNWKVTQEQWARDDTAYQRAYDDAIKAGFSPLVASGVSAGGVTSGLGAASPIPMDAFKAQAPNLDLSGVIDAVLGASKLNEERRHNQVTEETRLSELDLESKRLDNQAEQLRNQAQSLDIQQQKVDNLVATLAETISFHDRTLQQTFNLESEKLKQDRLSYQSKIFAERMDNLVGKNVPRIYVDSEYKARLHNQRASAAFESLMKDYISSGGSRFASSESKSHSESNARASSKSFSFSHGSHKSADVGAFGYGVGGKVGVSSGSSRSGSQSHSDYKSMSVSDAYSLYQSNDMSEAWKQRFAKYFRDYPVAIYVPRHDYKEYRESGGFRYSSIRGN